MFAGRQRAAGKRDTVSSRPQPAAGLPGAEGNSRHGGQAEAEDASTLPPLVSEVMSAVRLNWDFMTTSEFNPIPYALSLLDGSSLGRDYQAFCEIHDTLERAMDLIVNDYHQAFNNAIQTFSTVVDTISESKHKMLAMREDLEKCKGWLECKRFDLLHLWVKSIQFKEMSRILETILAPTGFSDELQKTPANIEMLIEGKYFLSAVRALTGAIRTLSGSDFSDIGAMEGVNEKLGDLKKVANSIWKIPSLWMLTPKALCIQSVFDAIVEELHDHLYLKTPISMLRIEQIAILQNQNALSCTLIPEFGAGNEYQFFSEAKIAFIDGQLHSETVDDFESNPEMDSFKHIQALVESMAILERLSDGLSVRRNSGTASKAALLTQNLAQTIKDRLSQELFNVVERTIEELEQSQARGLGSDGQDDSHDVESNLLATLLFSLYDKFETVALTHLFIIGVATRSLGVRK
nr:hypothetical protein HK105_000713 [Polyrhizophydium stewartii]